MWTAVVQARPLRRALQRGDPPVADLVEIHVERGLVELDHVDAGRLDRARLLVEDLGERPRELFAAPVVRVVERVDHRHRSRQRVLHLPRGRAAQEAGVVDVDRPAPRDRPDDDGHVGVVAVADAHRALVREVDAVESFDERGDEMPARLLAVADDVDAGFLLVAQHEPDRVALAFGERVAVELPRRPELVGCREPGWLRQAAGDRGLQKLGHRGRGRTRRGRERPEFGGADYSVRAPRRFRITGLTT